MYNSEKEFLKAYDPNQFERLSMTADILVLSVSTKDTNNYRKTDKKKYEYLVRKKR